MLSIMASANSGRRQPDLILSSKIFTTSDNNSLMSQITPTVVFDFEDGIDWQNLTRLCGEA